MRFAKIALTLIAIASVAGCATGSSTGKTEGYVLSPDGRVVKDPFDLCWRAGGIWSPASATAECDKDLLPKAAAPIAPAAPVATPTAPAVPVAPVPRAAPVAPPVAAAPPAAPKMCNFTASFADAELFAFDKAVLTPAAKSKLDGEVMSKLGACKSVTLLLVTGNTDRFGTANYNQKLSEKRASVVKAYLESKGAKEVETMGAGKTLPIKSCDDKKPRKEQIECLAPNRRVVIEATGPAK
jgi:OmpA-OmpF porin, OOP family